jgi:hypothetical protein
LFVTSASSAQEIRTITAPITQEDPTLAWAHSYTYAICGSENSTNALKVIRVSVESIEPTEIRKNEPHSVVLRVENSGRASVLLPVGRDIAVVGRDDGAVHYRAMYWVNGGIPSGAISLGWLELYGSSSDSNTVLNLNPGEWITLQGEVHPHRWFATEQRPMAYANLQLYVRDGSGRTPFAIECVKQGFGQEIAIHYPGIQTTR